MQICLKILYCFGALLSFADPFTDGLTCWKYYEAGKILWFALCIVFMLLPGIVYFVFWIFILPSDPDSGRVVSKLRYCFAAMCCPFLPCCGKLYVGLTTKKHEDHELYIEIFNCLEVAIELAPQFILQFYAAMVQERDISTIQIISLTVTFLRIGWCYARINEDCKCRMCLAGLLSVAARVFAFGLFTVALGPWVVLVIVLHMIITGVIQRSHKVRAFGYVTLSWLSYTPLGKDKDKETNAERVKWTSRTFVQPLLHVVEDILMAVLYYFFVDSSGRTYPHRLEIMFGLIGATLLGYIVLRLSKFGKCQRGQTVEFSEEENLNDDQVTVVVVDGGKKKEKGEEVEAGTSGDTEKGNNILSNIRARLPKRGGLPKTGGTSNKAEPEVEKHGDIADDGQKADESSSGKPEKQNKILAAVKARLPRRRDQGLGKEEGGCREVEAEKKADVGQSSSANNEPGEKEQRFGKAWVKSKFGKSPGKKTEEC